MAEPLERVRCMLQVLAALVKVCKEGDRLSYRQFAEARESLPGPFRQHLPALLFAQLPRDSADTIALHAVARYVAMRVILSFVRHRLVAYGSAADGALREHDLENYVFDNIQGVPQLAALQENFYPFYVFTAVRRFFFFLDPNRIGKISLEDLLGSKVLHDWLAVLPPTHPDVAPVLSLDRASSAAFLTEQAGMPEHIAERCCDLALSIGWEAASGSNWFTSSTALRVYSAYLQLDADQNGMLSQAEFAAFRGGSLTSAFTERVFEECHTYGGEMDYKAYLDTVLAVGHRATPQSIRFMFRLLDIQHRGFITLWELKYFFRHVAARLPALGHEGVEPGNVCDEIMDMVAPRTPGRITLDDLRRCKVGHVVCAILTDASAFIAYDRREDTLTTGGDGEHHGSGSSP